MYNRTLVFAAACVGLVLFGIGLITLGSILPGLVETFQLSEVGAGALVSILPLGILAGSLIFGPIVDRYGYKGMLTANALFMVAGLQGLAYSDTLWELQLSIFLVAFGGGVMNGAGSALVSDITEGGKGANLSLLGVFFGLGALGMPIMLGLLSERFSYQSIVSAVGLALLSAVFYFAFIRFPAPKNQGGAPAREGMMLIREPALLLLGFYLFFQSGAESLVTNWSTTYLLQKTGLDSREALFALSASVAGMTVARLLLSRLLRQLSPFWVLMASLGIALAGSAVLMSATTYGLAIVALAMLGTGLAGGFPIILGYIGDMYARLSGTAFSIAFTIALFGNMLINYLMGRVSGAFGIGQLTTALLLALFVMALLLGVVRGRIRGKVAV
ncbi:MAG: MFS transporter [Phaeodactylibacter sp.]|nr:MFS transporter [Phaeodactylibacter sp.]MCB9276158.1 MFS transporter [Lewinellaceae bacterium]